MMRRIDGNFLCKAFLFLLLLSALYSCQFRVYFLLYDFIPYFLLALLVGSFSNNINLGLAASIVVSLTVSVISEVKYYFLRAVLHCQDFGYLKNTELLRSLLEMYFNYKLAILAGLLLSFFVFLFFLAMRYKKQLYQSQRWRAFVSVVLCVMFVASYVDLRREKSYVRNFYRASYVWKNPLTHFVTPFKKMGTGVLMQLICYSAIQKDCISKVNGGPKLDLGQYGLQKNDKKPDVILILQESLFNINKLQMRNIPYIAMLDESRLDCFGDLRVHTYGGETQISEVNVLTAIDFGIIPGSYLYNPYTLFLYMDKSVPNMLLKAGYDTYFISSYKGSVFGVHETFGDYGFKHITSDRDFDKDRKKIQDSDLFDVALRTLKDQNNQPKFIFIETMQNHGPWRNNEATKNFAIEGEATGGDQIDEYLTRVENIDQSFQELMNYVEHAKKDTILIYFGDHLPSFGSQLKFTDPNLTDYDTFYAIKSNFPINKNLCLNNLDALYMSGLILDLIGKNDDIYFQLNSKLRRKEQGKFDREKSEQVQSYLNYVQNFLADKMRESDEKCKYNEN